MSHRKKVLWLVSWYPNKYNVFDGDFIQRHARAASLQTDIHVLFVKFSEQQMEVEQVLTTYEGLTEQLIYVPKKSGPAGVIQNYFRWRNLHRQEIRKILQTVSPELVHVHIPWKVGLIALWAKKELGIPFFVTEHWGIYNNVVEDNIGRRPFLMRQLLKQIFKQSFRFSSVSQYLGEGVNKTLLKKAYIVIPNVVDTSLFNPSATKHVRFSFVHVSNMVPLKNVQGLLEAFQHFLETTGADAQLILIGNKDDEYLAQAKNLNLLDTAVFFKGELPYKEVAAEVRQCHAFVLNSDIENSPCVIGEALCSGLPVIATRVGGIPELVNEQNGILVSPKNPIALSQAMQKIYGSTSTFSAQKIADAAANKFSAQTISEAFLQLYNPKRS